MNAITRLNSFTSREFAASNHFTVYGAMTGFMSGAFVGSLCGIAAAMIGHYLFYLVLLFPVVIGLAIGAVIGKSIEYTKLRDPVTSAGAAFVAAVFAAIAVHVTNFSFFQSELALAPAEELEIARNISYYEENRQALNRGTADLLDLMKADPLYLKALQVESIADFLDYEATVGMELKSSKTGAGRKGVNLGYVGTCIYWLAEIGIMAYVAIPLVWRRAKRPFCEQCDQWHSATNLGMCLGKGKDVADLFRRGRQHEISTIADERNMTSFHMMRCPGCGSPGSPILQINRTSVVNGVMKEHPLAHFCLNEEQAAQVMVWLVSRNEAQAPAATPHAAVKPGSTVSGANLRNQSQGQANDEVARYMADLLARQSSRRESDAHEEQKLNTGVRQLADEASRAASQSSMDSGSQNRGQTIR